LLRLHRDQEALDSYERAAELAPDNGDAWAGQYRALIRLGRDAEAYEAAKRATRLNIAEALHRNRH
jgi:Flp pilus assembly protein TadD